jgi:hypothetical protein
LLLYVFIMMTCPVSASSLNLSPDYQDNHGSYFFSYANFSMDEVTKWRDEMPVVSYVFPHPDKCYRYYAAFIPIVPGDADLAGYYMEVLPGGVSSSYTEIIDAGAVPPSQDEFLARANEWINSEQDSVIKAMDDCFGSGVSFYDGYYEIARHKTVRSSRDIGQVTVVTVVSQYLNDGDPERDSLCIGSYIEMTPEDGTGNRTGWKNSQFRVIYDYNAGYDSVKPFEGSATRSNPQTSPRYMAPRGDLSAGFLNTVDVFGLMTGLFGHSVSFHSGPDDFGDRFWIMKCGYFTESAEESLRLAPVSEVMPYRPAADDYDWHVLARIGIDAESGWSRFGGLESGPSPSSEWGNYILIHRAAEEI